MRSRSNWWRRRPAMCALWSASWIKYFPRSTHRSSAMVWRWTQSSSRISGSSWRARMARRWVVAGWPSSRTSPKSSACTFAIPFAAAEWRRHCSRASRRRRATPVSFYCVWKRACIKPQRSGFISGPGFTPVQHSAATPQCDLRLSPPASSWKSGSKHPQNKTLSPSPQNLRRAPRALGQRLELGPANRRVADARAEPAIGSASTFSRPTSRA